jgi:hypothetical protein
LRRYFLRWRNPSSASLRFLAYAELLSEHAILDTKIFDDVLLSLIDPTGRDKKQQLPGMQRGMQISPNAY